MVFKGNTPVDFHLTSTHFGHNDYVDEMVPLLPTWSTLVTISSVIRARRI